MYGVQDVGQEVGVYLFKVNKIQNMELCPEKLKIWVSFKELIFVLLYRHND